MANIKSQIKRNRQAAGRRLRGKSVRSELKTTVRRFEEAVEAGDRATAEDALRDAMKAYDQAAAKGIVHRNKAANKKSRLAKRLGASS